MHSIFSNAVRHEVFYRMGNFANDQIPRFVKAPFDVVFIESALGGPKNQYVEPKPFLIQNGNIQTTLGELLNTSTPWPDNEDAYIERTGFGFIGKPIMVGEHEMGSPGDSTLFGMHKFSLL